MRMTVEAARQWVLTNLPLVVFSTFYFLTTVLVNILYAVGVGRDWPANFVPNFSWSHFTVEFGALYWILLLSPFVALPLIAIPTAKVARPGADWLGSFLAEFQKLPYTVLCLLLYAYVSFEFWHDGAVAKLLGAGSGAMDQVRERFALQAEIGFPTQVALLSLLQFFAIYATVKAMRQRDWFWRFAALLQVIAMVTALILLNMKWPVILFIITLGVVVFATARRFAILSTIAVMFCAVVVYLLISVALLRMGPPEPIPRPIPTPARAAVQSTIPAPTRSARAEPATGNSETASAVSVRQRAPKASVSVAAPAPAALPYVVHLASAAKDNVGTLAIVLLNRMGDEVPFYYDTFTTKGPFCGTFFDWFFHAPGMTCRPSTYIYTEMFHDDFAGDGTAPAAFHIYEYAREGWPGVAVALVLGGIFLGAFMALRGPARESDIAATVFVMGAPVAYTLSQLPLEGAIIYANGIVWWGGVLILNSLALTAYRKRPSP